MSDDDFELRRRAIESQRWTKQAQLNDNLCALDSVAQARLDDLFRHSQRIDKRIDLAMKCIRYLAISFLGLGIHILIQYLRPH